MSMSFEEWLQSRLPAHGCSVGPMYGKSGRKTTDAIKACQATHGLSRDGKADDRVAQLLREPATDKATQADPIPERDKELDITANPPGVKNIWPRQSGV